MLFILLLQSKINPALPWYVRSKTHLAFKESPAFRAFLPSLILKRLCACVGGWGAYRGRSASGSVQCFSKVRLCHSCLQQTGSVCLQTCWNITSSSLVVLIWIPKSKSLSSLNKGVFSLPDAQFSAPLVSSYPWASVRATAGGFMGANHAVCGEGLRRGLSSGQNQFVNQIQRHTRVYCGIFPLDFSTLSMSDTELAFTQRHLLS